MNQTLLSRFGSPLERVEKALNFLRRGEGVIVTDDEDRENEGDLILAAETITIHQMNQLIRECSGIVCLCMPKEKIQSLGLPMMVQNNTSRFGTAFTVSVDAAQGITTGVSAADRTATVKAAIADNAVTDDLSRPGHMFPLVAAPGGVLERKGHTEATVDLARLAGLKPYGLLCELMNPDGAMARLPELVAWAEKHGTVVITIEDLVAYRTLREKNVCRLAEANLPTKYGEFKVIAYKSEADPGEHVALVMGDINAPGPVLVRVDSECDTGGVFGRLRCDCGDQLSLAMQAIGREGRGAVIYLRRENQGQGLLQMIGADSGQGHGQGVMEAGKDCGFPADRPDYHIGVQMIKDLGIREVVLLDDNPLKRKGLEDLGLKVVNTVPVTVSAGSLDRS